MSKKAELYYQKSRHFDSLYASVTAEIESFYSTENSLSGDDIEWIKGLVMGFNEKYKIWITTEQNYLDALFKKEDKLFILCGLAFLHISNDLPPVIAGSIKDPHSTDELYHSKANFELLKKPLRKSIAAKWKKAWQIKLLMFKPFRFEGMFMAWLVNLREQAWDSANKILHAEDATIATAELRQAVFEAMKAAKLESRMLFWVRIFQLGIAAFFVMLIIAPPNFPVTIGERQIISYKLFSHEYTIPLFVLVVGAIWFLIRFKTRKLPVLWLRFNPKKKRSD